MAQIGLLGYGMQDVLTHVFGVGCGKPHAHVGHGAGHLAQQLRERCAALHGFSRWRQTVAVYVLSQQRYLLEALVVQVGHLAQYALYVA